MNKFIEVPNQKVWALFLLWFNDNIEKYKWIPITPADRVNVYNQKDELIAYKIMQYGQKFYVRELEYLMLIGGN